MDGIGCFSVIKHDQIDIMLILCGLSKRFDLTAFVLKISCRPPLFDHNTKLGLENVLSFWHRHSVYVTYSWYTTIQAISIMQIASKDKARTDPPSLFYKSDVGIREKAQSRQRPLADEHFEEGHNDANSSI